VRLSAGDGKHPNSPLYRPGFYEKVIPA
jgi:hypothetical protein